MNWSGGPRSWTLTDGGCVTVAQITLDDDGRYHVYNYTPEGEEIISGTGQDSTFELAKRTAEAVARQHNAQVAQS